MGVQGIPESGPVEDNTSGGPGGWPGGRHPSEERRPLLPGRDEVSLSPPAQGALGIVQGCLLDAISGALDMPRVAGFGMPGGVPPVLDPAVRAAQVCSEAGSLLQRAVQAQHPDPAEALTRGAREGMAQAMTVLERLGHLEGEAGAAVSAFFEAWAGQLARLVAALDSSA